MQNEEASIIFKKYLGKMVDSPMFAMIGKSSLNDIDKILDGALDKKLLFLLNRELIKIKK